MGGSCILKCKLYIVLINLRLSYKVVPSAWTWRGGKIYVIEAGDIKDIPDCLPDLLEVQDCFLLPMFDKLQAWDISQVVLVPSKKDCFLKVLWY